MKRKLCLVLSLLMAAMSLHLNASAATTETISKKQYFENTTIENLVSKSVGGSKDWRAHPSTEGYELVTEPDGNTVFALPVMGDGEWIGGLFFAISAGYIGYENNIRRSIIDVKMPDTQGYMELFNYKKDYSANYNDSSNTPIVLKNGGAYVTDIDDTGTRNIVWFVDEGTLQADTWYKVERILDLRTPGKNRQRARVYDISGNIIGQSPWTICGTTGPHSTYKMSMFTLFLATREFTDKVYVDNLETYKVTLQDIGTTAALDESMKTISVEFSEPMDTETITKDTVSLTVGGGYTGEINYDVAYAEETDTLSVTYDRLPFDADISLTLDKTILNAEGWDLVNNVVKNFKTGSDPCTYSGSITDTEGVKTAAVTVTNGDEIDRDYIVMLISKNAGGVITACKAVSGNVEAGKTADVTTEGITLAEGETAEIYVVDDWKNFKVMRN